MLERLAEYAWRLRRELRFGRGAAGKYEVASILVNLTGRAQPNELSMTQRDLGGAGPSIRAVVKTLREEDAVTTLKKIKSGALSRCNLAWVPLMRNGGEVDTINEWKALAASEPDPHLRGDLGGIARVFAELAKRRNVWEKHLEGWNMEQSQVVLEWQNEGAKATLLRVMRRRFGEPLPKEIEAAVKSQNNSDELGRWVDAASTANDLASWRVEIGV
jgi:hypothetical protein